MKKAFEQGGHKRNLENYASFVETTDEELASTLGGIYGTFWDPTSVERRNLEYGCLDAEIEKMQEWEEIREKLIEQYGESIVNKWGEDTLIAMLSHMKDLPVNYTNEDIINMLAMCRTEKDRVFIGTLMQGKYSEAFALAPNELSPEISYVLADYSAHLIRYDKKGKYEEGEKEFTNFNNAMLASDRDICYMLRGIWVQENVSIGMRIKIC